MQTLRAIRCEERNTRGEYILQKERGLEEKDRGMGGGIEELGLEGEIILR